MNKEVQEQKRLRLHQKLLEFCEHVYFQPPKNVQMTYPAIVYSRRTGNASYANNAPYRFTQQYDLCYISKDPSDGVVEALAANMPGIRYDRHSTIENLHHDYFYLSNYC